MIEQIEQLEKRVEALLRVQEAARQQVAEARRENERLRAQIDQLAGTKTQNDQLQSQVAQLETELEGMSSKETQIRERLRTILGKIDSIENELTASGGAQ